MELNIETVRNFTDCVFPRILHDQLWQTKPQHKIQSVVFFPFLFFSFLVLFDKIGIQLLEGSGSLLHKNFALPGAMDTQCVIDVQHVEICLGLDTGILPPYPCQNVADDRGGKGKPKFLQKGQRGLFVEGQPPQKVQPDPAVAQRRHFDGDLQPIKGPGLSGQRNKVDALSPCRVDALAGGDLDAGLGGFSKLAVGIRFGPRGFLGVLGVGEQEAPGAAEGG
mmetsp:Transcript_833/g.2081  ORF Transcript_833/g.2081 Transcript_833/m.2081 type:complete len:222 (-) Transcript_833:414-1079(-)